MRKIFKIDEVKSALVISIVLTLLLIVYINMHCSEDVVAMHIADNYGTFISLSATLLGFLITAYTILIAFPENYKIAILRQHKLYPILYEVFHFTAMLLLAFLITSIIGLVLGVSSIIFSYFMILILIFSLFLVFRVMWILKQVTDSYT
jgi:hypothetical protein